MKIQECLVCPELLLIRQNKEISSIDQLVKVQELFVKFQKDDDHICARRCKKFEEKLLNKIELHKTLEVASQVIKEDILHLQEKISSAERRILKQQKEIDSLRAIECPKGAEASEAIEQQIKALERKNEETCAKKAKREEKLQNLLELEEKITQAGNNLSW